MIEVLNNIADKWFNWELAILWQIAVLISIVWVIDLLIRKWAWPQLRYALWLLILLKLVLPPTLTSPASFTAEIPFLAQKAVRVHTNQPETTPQTARVAEPVEPLAAAVSENATYYEPTPAETEVDPAFPNTAIEPIAPVAAAASLSWKVYLFFVWLAGIVILSAWLILRLTGLRREHLKGDGHFQRPERLSEQLTAVAAKLNLKNIPQLILTDRVCCPAVFGVFRPVLLMPADKLKNLTRQDVEHIFLHELAHIKRGDLLIHAVHMCLQIVYWFNPLLWLIRKQLQNLRELCCDATVAKILKDKTYRYRETLLETARQLLAEPVDPGLGLMGLFENSNWLVERLKWLEKKTWKNRPLRIVTVLVLVGVMISCVLPMAKGAGAGEDSSNIVAKEYWLKRPVLQNETSLLTTVSRALKTPVSDLLKEVTGRSRSKDYNLWAIPAFGKVVLVANDKQHAKAAKALRKEYGDLLRPEKIYDISSVTSIDVFADNFGKIAQDVFTRQKFTFLTDEDVNYIADDLAGFVRTYARGDVSKQTQMAVLESLDKYFYKYFPSATISQQEDSYLRFDDKIKTLKLKLWQVLATEPLTDEQRETLAKQKQWIYDFADNFPDTTELDKVRRMYKVDAIFDDVLNGFSMQPMSEDTFKELQKDIREEDNINGAATQVSIWSTRIAFAKRRKLKPKSSTWAYPFGIVRSFGGTNDMLNFSFKSEKPQLMNQEFMHDIKPYDLASRSAIETPESLTTVDQLKGWLNEQGKGDFYYDKESLSILRCRDAKMAVLDVHSWIESDKISSEQISNIIAANPITQFSPSGYKGLEDSNPRHKDMPVAPLIAIISKGGDIAVVSFRNLQGHLPNSLNIVIRHRFKGWDDLWFSTFITGSRRKPKPSDTTNSRSDEKPAVQVEGGGAIKNANFNAVLDNGVTVELVGICELPNDKRWWAPNGEILDKAIYSFGPQGVPLYNLPAGHKAYAFAAKHPFEEGGRLNSLITLKKSKNSVYKADGDDKIVVLTKIYVLYLPEDMDAFDYELDIDVSLLKMTSDEYVANGRGESEYEKIIFKNVSLRPGVKTEVEVAPPPVQVDGEGGLDSAKQSIGKSLEQEMTLILGWSGEEVKIPAPVIMPQEFKETKEFRLRQQGKTSGDTTVFDTEGYKYVIRPYGIKKDSESGLKETMYFISRYRPNGILDADASYIDGVNFASEWQSYDVNGLKEVYIIRRPTSKDCKKKVRFYDRKGNKTKEWHVSEFDVVYGEMIIDTEGNSNFSYYLKDLIHSPYPQPPPVQVEGKEEK